MLKIPDELPKPPELSFEAQTLERLQAFERNPRAEIHSRPHWRDGEQLVELYEHQRLVGYGSGHNLLAGLAAAFSDYDYRLAQRALATTPPAKYPSCGCGN